MAKRNNNVVILSSSSDDDDNENNKNKTNRNCFSENPKPKRSNNARTTSSANPKPRSKNNKKKKPRLSDSLSSFPDPFSAFDDLKFFSEDLSEDFAGVKVSTGGRRVDGTETWVDKYRPRCLEDLAVHKKKVEEVKTWFEERLMNTKKCVQNYVLLTTGPTGTGKSATIRVITSHYGAEICEWNTPTPTIWQEHRQLSSSGMRYISKLDEFENFVERVRKYRILSSSTGSSRTPVVLLIEDLPVAHNRSAQRRLFGSLQLLVKSVEIPTVILLTEYGGSDSSDVSLRYWEELSSSLESAGACKVAFNPITVNSIKKVLSKICRQEQCDTMSEQIDLIANSSGGDIRHAITTLEYFCLRQGKKMVISSSKHVSRSVFKAHDQSDKNEGLDFPLGRDLTLSLFHALGKFLHNKRETESAMETSEDGFILKAELTRLPLKMDAPEKVLCQAYGQSRPVAEFLHENVLDFLNQDAIEDAWSVLSYLSDADYLLSSVHGIFGKNYETENLLQSAAASVAVRGVLFGNAHPSPSRWHAIRRPMLWQVEKSGRHNLDNESMQTVWQGDMQRRRLDHYHGLSFSDVSAVCIDYGPALKWLGNRASLNSEYPEVHSSSIRSDEMEDDSGQKNCLDWVSETTDDDIEDW